jgi:hypothetical protein
MVETTRKVAEGSLGQRPIALKIWSLPTDDDQAEPFEVVYPESRHLVSL